MFVILFDEYRSMLYRAVSDDVCFEVVERSDSKQVGEDKLAGLTSGYTFCCRSRKWPSTVDHQVHMYFDNPPAPGH